MIRVKSKTLFLIFFFCQNVIGQDIYFPILNDSVFSNRTEKLVSSSPFIEYKELESGIIHRITYFENGKVKSVAEIKIEYRDKGYAVYDYDLDDYIPIIEKGYFDILDGLYLEYYPEIKEEWIFDEPSTVTDNEDSYSYTTFTTEYNVPEGKKLSDFVPSDCDSSTLRIRAKGKYKNNKPIGEWQTVNIESKNTVIIELNNEGLFYGNFIEYYIDSCKEKIGVRIEGNYTIIDISKFDYISGQDNIDKVRKIGEWIYYHIDGTLLERTNYTWLK